MKTLHPVDEAMKAKIGKAYLICSQFPDVFNDVTLEKFCSMFVDVIPEGENEQDARMKAAAPEMRRLLHAAFMAMAEAGVDEPLRLEIDECLCHIDGELCPADTENEKTYLPRQEKMKDYAEDMYWMLSNIRYELQHGGARDSKYVSQVIREVGEVLSEIDSEEDADDE